MSVHGVLSSSEAALVDDLEGRLTAARAGYLDNLSAGAVALQASVDDLETRLTAARAGYLDDLRKIDALATTGLLATSNSLVYRVAEIERHFHSYERWFGLAGTPDAELHRADAIAKDIAPFVIDAGNDTWGSWVQILGSNDTTLTFDLHRLMITDVERDAAVHFVQIACGTTGDAALAAGTYTEFVYKPQATNTEETPLFVQMRRQSAGTKIWARVLAYDADTGTVSFYLGLHSYEG